MKAMIVAVPIFCNLASKRTICTSCSWTLKTRFSPFRSYWKGVRVVKRSARTFLKGNYGKRWLPILGRIPFIKTTAVISLLPMFLENAHSVAMVRYFMNVIKSVVQLINPGETPVMTHDKTCLPFLMEHWSRSSNYIIDLQLHQLIHSWTKQSIIPQTFYQN